MTIPEATHQAGAAVLEILTAAALAGDRCPTNEELRQLLFRRGIVTGTAYKWPATLARAGHLRIEVFRHNYRVVTLARGPHKGAETARLDSQPGVSLTPHMVILPGDKRTLRPTRFEADARRWQARAI